MNTRTAHIAAHQAKETRMAAEAGWYPDPEGDTSRLRYWNGTQWTSDYTAAPGAAQAGAGTATAGATQAADANAYAQSAAPNTTASTSNMGFQTFDAEQVYPMTSQDRTLRLIAFILNVVSCVSVAYFIIPLAWMVPMTVYSWSLYKGKRPNTTAFGVCTLIFVNLVSGILLLVSHKDVPPVGDPGNNMPQQ